MNIQEIINSGFGVRLAMIIGRLLPRKAGYRLADFLADRISSVSKRSMVKAVLANQWVVAGGQITPEELKAHTRLVFRNVARSLYNFYRTMDSPLERQALIEPNSTMDEFIDRYKKYVGPLVLVGTHLGNFDLLLTSAGWQGLKMIAIGWHNPGSGYQLQNIQRFRAGVPVYPASMSTIRLAQKHLKEGGKVVIGCDRPVTGSKYRPLFFGRPAALNVVYAQLALSCNAPVIVAGFTILPNGQARLIYSQPIQMRSLPNHHEELVYNAERVLEVAADIIRQSPTEWAMFYPVWPEVLNEICVT